MRFQSFGPEKVLLAAALLLLTTGCTSIAKSIVEEPKVQLAHVGLKDVTQDGATILIGVQVDNPNPFALTFDALRYDLEVGGKLLSSGQIPEAVSVGGKAVQVVEIPVAVKFQDLFSSILDFMQKTSSNYRVKGEARFGLLTVPFDQSGEMKLR